MTVHGKYVDTGIEVWLYDENGETTESVRKDKTNKVIFYVDHFSSYEGGNDSSGSYYADSYIIEYSTSDIIKMGEGTTIDVINEADAIIKIWVDSGALDVYMEEQGISQVNLTVDVIETLVESADGSSYYQIEFEFGPSGAFFSPNLEVRLEGVYYNNSNVWMYDKDGQPLETYDHGSDGKLYFLVPHFSSYSFDEYDY